MIAKLSEGIFASRFANMLNYVVKKPRVRIYYVGNTCANGIVKEKKGNPQLEN